MNPLDRFFKNKLQNREFEFQDAYWQQAEQMIIADQAGRRWKKGFWFLGALLLLTFTAFIFWPGNPEGSVSPNTQVSEFGTSIPLNNVAEDQELITKEETAKSLQNDQLGNSKKSHLNSKVSKGGDHEKTAADLDPKVLEVGNTKKAGNQENFEIVLN